MDAAWEIYIDYIVKPNLIRVDTQIAGTAPLETHPFSIRCFIAGLPVGGDLLPTEEALKRISAFEIKAEALTDGTGVYVGRVSLVDLTVFAFYARNAQTLIGRFKTSAELTHVAPFECNARDDPQWSFYQTALYPTPKRRNRIENDRIRRLLIDQGDDGKKPRKIDHFAYFPDAASADAFARYIALEGYEIERRSTASDKKRKFSIVFSKGQIPFTVDENTWKLRVISKQLNGEYGSWKSPAVGSAE